MTWSVVAADSTGTSHVVRGLPCQDAHLHAVFGPADDWLVVAVADGAGSASRAEVGAALACREFIARVVRLGPDGLHSPEVVAALFAGVRDELLAEAERLTVSPRELACTALLAVVGPTAAVFAQLGDGAIVVGNADYRRVVFWPEPAEYANATDFLTDDRFARAVRVESSAEAIDELCVMTDGLQRVALDFTTQTLHSPFFDPMFGRVRDAGNPAELADPLRGFLDSPRVNERTDDDKTLFLATRRQ